MSQPNWTNIDRLSLADFDPFRCRADDLAAREAYEWVPDEAQHVTDFLEDLCRLSSGRWSGQLMRLFPFQQDFIWRLHGWRHKDTGLRRFTEAYWEIAKKNCKSPTTAGLALYHLFADGENSPEVYINASARDQATVVYKSVSRMIRQEPAFKGVFREVDSQKRIYCLENDGLLVANSAEAPSKDGIQASFIVWDELHRQPDRELWDVFAHAGISRLAPLSLVITTAGEPDPEHPCYIQHKRALAVEEGSREDQQFLGVVHSPREPDPDIDDPKVWRMANPAMPHIFTEESFAADLQKAKDEGPAALYTFKRLRLNIWEKVEHKWINVALWNEQEAPRTDEEIAASGDIWTAGLDMSEGGDLCAYVRVAGSIKDGLDCRAWFWAPRETAVRRQREENLPYLEWCEQNHIFLIDEPIINPLVIRDFIIEDAGKIDGKLRRIYSDRFNSSEIAHGVRAAGYDHQFTGQGWVSQHQPIRFCEQLLKRQVLRHGNHPILTVHAANALVKDDNPNRNKRLKKPGGFERVDGIAALINGVAAMADVSGWDGISGEMGEAKPTITSGKIFFV